MALNVLHYFYKNYIKAKLGIICDKMYGENTRIWERRSLCSSLGDAIYLSVRPQISSAMKIAAQTIVCVPPTLAPQ
ncbi:hypothetical protein WH47_03995 [Habropoda laboriosa]|uniref:Uncharacterized protein n=1 Tax=Habropoda laboriosa TaxID=597456 RepID=A0A0L7QUA2_9HYME|nr:hypothetical protein WH47_03995 [Habropoda laboriosa]